MKKELSERLITLCVIYIFYQRGREWFLQINKLILTEGVWERSPVTVLFNSKLTKMRNALELKQEFSSSFLPSGH